MRSLNRSAAKWIEKSAAVSTATPRQLEQLRTTREAMIDNPHAARRVGQAAMLGHLAKKVSPGAGQTILDANKAVANVAERADIGLGSALHRLGVPEGLTLSEERIHHGDTPHGVPGQFSGEKAYVHRVSGPIARLAGIGSAIGTGLWLKNKLLESDPQKDDALVTDPSLMPGVAASIPPTGAAPVSSGASPMKVAQAAVVLNQQATLLKELHSYASDQAKTAAAMCQAVKLAQDGLIDVDDIFEHARQLSDSGSTKLSAVDDLFHETPGTVEKSAGANSTTEQLDPLTRVLRGIE